MIQKQSYIKITDNTGGTIGQCIGLHGKESGIGKIITISIKNGRKKEKSGRRYK